MLLLTSILITIILSFLITVLVFWISHRYQLLDHPNERSSHYVPTPRGGGISIVISFLIGILLVQDLISPSILIAIFGAGLGVGAIGFIDDCGNIGIWWRLSVHFICAVWALFWIGFPSDEFVQSICLPRDIVVVLSLIFLVWMLNLYNFMDGIDGIATAEVLTTCIGAVFTYFIADPLHISLIMRQENSVLGLTLAAAAFGFFILNYPPAKIFMGDVGSGFLGLILGILCLNASLNRPSFLWCWVILLGVFIVDASMCLVRRLLNGERIFSAHRDHAYQHAAIKFRSHKAVTLATILINFFWLLPWAMMVAVAAVPGWLALLIAYIPLLILAIMLRAGKRMAN